MHPITQYAGYIRPDWAPPGWLFAPVWTVLYIIIAITFGYVFYQYFKGRIKWNTALPFFLNLIFNIAFTPIMFGLGNMQLAAVDVLLVLATIIWMMVVARRKAWIVLANIPYLLWVIFATFLQLSIVYLNSPLYSLPA